MPPPPTALGRPPLRVVPSAASAEAEDEARAEALAACGWDWDHDDEAERAVLGTPLLDGAEWPRVAAAVTAETFFRPVHGVIFEAMGRIAARGEPIDVVTLAAELRRHERLNTVGGAQYVGELTDRLAHEVGTTLHLDAHLRLVLDHAARRKAALFGRGLLARAKDSSRPIGETLAGAQVAIATIPVPGSPTPTLAAGVEGYFARLEGQAGPRVAPPVRTGISALDAALHGGLRAQSLLLVGHAGTGKTTLALQLAAHIARTQGPVYFWSKEQERDGEVTPILLATLARLAFAKVRAQFEQPERPVLTQDELTALAAAGNILHGLALHVADESTPGCPQTVAEIVAAVRALPAPPVAIFIDNLGELKTRGVYRDEHAGLLEVMRDLRGVRKLLGIPVVTLAHPNRESAKGALHRRLRATDVLGGSAAERVCDGVLLMHREDLHPTRDHQKEPAESGITELFSPKVRGIGKLFCEVRSIEQEHRFVSARQDDAAPGAVAAGAAVDPFDAGEGLPEDPSVVFVGETAPLALAPAVDDGTEGEPW